MTDIPVENLEFNTLYERANAGDLSSRDVLSPEERWSVICAGAAALPLNASSFDHELRNILAEGCPVDLLVDILIQMAAYFGYPRSRQCLERLASIGNGANRSAIPHSASSPPTDEERFQCGISVYGQLNSKALNTIRKAFDDIAPDMVDLTFRSFGDVFARSQQALQVRQLATLAALGVLANAAPQFRFHVGASLNVGVPRAKIVECIYWIQFLAGMPAAYNALIEVKAAFADDADAPPAYE